MPKPGTRSASAILAPFGMFSEFVLLPVFTMRRLSQLDVRTELDVVREDNLRSGIMCCEQSVSRRLLSRWVVVNARFAALVCTDDVDDADAGEQNEEDGRVMMRGLIDRPFDAVAFVTPAVLVAVGRCRMFAAL